MSRTFALSLIGGFGLAVVGASSAFAAPSTLDIPGGAPFIYPVSSTDLLQTAVVSSTGTFDGEGAGPSVLNNGIFRINGGNPSDNSQLTTPTPGAAVTFALDLVAAPAGYNVSTIATYGGWNDQGRDRQTFTISYSTVANPSTFSNVDSIDYEPANLDGGVSPVLAVFPTSLTSVASLRFTFGAQENGHSGYGEFDVAGSAVPVPEPTTVGLIGAGLVGMLARRRRA